VIGGYYSRWNLGLPLWWNTGDLNDLGFNKVSIMWCSISYSLIKVKQFPVATYSEGRNAFVLVCHISKRISGKLCFGPVVLHRVKLIAALFEDFGSHILDLIFWISYFGSHILDLISYTFAWNHDFSIKKTYTMRLLFSSLLSIMLVGNTRLVTAHPSSFQPDEDRPSRLLKQDGTEDMYNLYPDETPMKTMDLMNLVPTPRATSYW